MFIWERMLSKKGYRPARHLPARVLIDRQPGHTINTYQGALPTL